MIYFSKRRCFGGKDPKPTMIEKQGYPLSPYLFLFCLEGLSALHRKAIEAQHIQGIMSCWNGISISHLLFADDSLLFCPAILSDCSHLLHILGSYEQASGQGINRQKTVLFFSPNMAMEVRENIHNMLNAQIVT